MKKAVMSILVILLLCIFLLAVCKLGGYMRLIRFTQQPPDYSLGLLTVYFEQEGDVIIRTSYANTDRIVRFSSEREAAAIFGLKLQHIENLSSFLGKALPEVIEQYGVIHTDIGSGLYIPSYITEDAYLVSFYLDNDVICKVIRIDLFSNEVVEEADLWQKAKDK